MAPPTRDLKPLKKLAGAAASCSAQSLAYGACIGASYQEVAKGMCDKEFLAFKECVTKAVGKKW